MTDEYDRSEAVFDWSKIGSPSVGVSSAVAEFTGKPVTKLPPIQESIDSDAMDALLADTKRVVSDDVTLTFEYEDVRVRVDGTGRIELSWRSED